MQHIFLPYAHIPTSTGDCHGHKMAPTYATLFMDSWSYDGCVLRSRTEIPSNGQNHTVIADMRLVGKPLHKDEIYSVAFRYTKW